MITILLFEVHVGQVGGDTSMPMYSVHKFYDGATSDWNGRIAITNDGRKSMGLGSTGQPKHREIGVTGTQADILIAILNFY